MPDAAALPAAPSITRLAGKGKVDATFEDGDAGDRLTLRVTMRPGGRALGFDGTAEVILAVVGSGGQGVTIYVPPGTFAAAGKTWGVRDPDGTALVVATGRKGTETETSAIGGTVTIKPGKKSVKVQAKLQGVDLAALDAGSTATVRIGGHVARTAVRVSGTRAKRRLARG